VVSSLVLLQLLLSCSALQLLQNQQLAGTPNLQQIIILPLIHMLLLLLFKANFLLQSRLWLLWLRPFQWHSSRRPPTDQNPAAAAAAVAAAAVLQALTALVDALPDGTPLAGPLVTNILLQHVTRSKVSPLMRVGRSVPSLNAGNSITRVANAAK
jgi:hypothetical protein